MHFTARQLTCPAEVSMGFGPDTTVHFPKATCVGCPLRARCTTSSNGRSVAIHPRMQSKYCWPSSATTRPPPPRARLRERVKVEHALAHIGRWQGRRARYRRTRNNLFDLRRVVARQPAAGNYQLAA